MSIYFEFEVGKTGRRFRRAVESDKHDIKLILRHNSNAKVLFGEPDIGALIELSVLPICMINENKQVVGFMALSDYPDVPGVDPSDWEYWMRNLYQRFYLSRNTLFIHYMCCIDDIADHFMEEALISVFSNDSYLLHIIIVIPFDYPEKLLIRHTVFKKRNFYKFSPKGVEDRVGNYLITALRQDFCPKLKIRRAVEEDNDDIVEILNKTCPRLKDMYGSYYISEIIGRHPESGRKILVGDVQGRAVSVMCLNTEINYRKLQKSYELQPYYGLNAATPSEKEQNKRANELLTMFGNPILKGIWHPYEFTPKDQPREAAETSRSRAKNKVTHQVPSKKLSKVNFRKNARMRQSLDHIIVREFDSDDFSDRVFNITTSPLVSTTTSYSVLNMLDDDPFDYDIVNIEKKWITHVASSEERPAILKTPSPKQTSEGPQKKQRPIIKTKMRNKNVKIVDDVTVYQGARNAFVIELFALRDDIDDSHSFDMLEAAFEFMKAYDYCVIHLPASERSFPLLQHFSFVPLKPRVCSHYALYVAHRSSVMGRLRVREAEIIDIPDIAKLLHPLDGKDTLYGVESMILNKCENQAFVFTSGMTVVGLAILEPADEVDFLRARFNLDSYQIHKYRYEGNGVTAGFGTIKCIIVYPVFEVHYRFFLRDLMRLSGTNTLMYVSAYRNKWAVQKGNALVSAMVPLVPRKFEIDSDTIHHLKRIGAMSEAIVAFSGWFIGRKLTSVPKVTVSTRIVIVGASRTAFGFMKSLLFGQTSTYLTFTNVTLVSSHGLPYMRHAKPVAESMFMKFYRSSDKYLKSVPYTYYVNVIQARMADINLQDKYITLTSGNRCYYDLLFLFFGKQYQHPNYMKHLLEREREFQSQKVPVYQPLHVPKYSDTDIQIAAEEAPENVFIINHIQEANKALEYVKNYLCCHDSKIIVYGATIHAYLCINALLSINVSPENIIFIEPFPLEDPKKTRIPEFYNEYVDQTVKEVLDNLKITVYRSYYFQSWTLNAENRITHVDFLAYANYLHLECSALFYYGKRGINMRAFVAIHKSGLSYDGGVIIDDECRTRDPFVYAAGPHTRYHRRYYADSHIHKYFNSYEIGYKLGTRVRNRLDPLFFGPKCELDNRRRSTISPNQTMPDPSRESETTYKHPNLLDLKKPKVTHCILPGGLHYLDVRSPGLKLPHHYVQSMGYNGFMMETYKKGYFKLHLNKELYVDGITCLSPENFSLEKFKNLYGHSAKILKNVHLRFSTNKLDDFYEFFRAPWAFFLYHDQVEDLFTMSKELYPKGQATGSTIKEALSLSLQGKSTDLIRDSFKRSPYFAAITDYVMDWLSQNDILLPMYLQPWQNSQYAYDLDNNPLFRNSKTQADKEHEQLF